MCRHNNKLVLFGCMMHHVRKRCLQSSTIFASRAPSLAPPQPRPFATARCTSPRTKTPPYSLRGLEQAPLQRRQRSRTRSHPCSPSSQPSQLQQQTGCTAPTETRQRARSSVARRSTAARDTSATARRLRYARLHRVKPRMCATYRQLLRPFQLRGSRASRPLPRSCEHQRRCQQRRSRHSDQSHHTTAERHSRDLSPVQRWQGTPRHASPCSPTWTRF